MKFHNMFICATVAFLTFLVAQPERTVSRLPAPVADIMGQPVYRHAHWGLLAVDLETGEVLASKNADRLFGPASVTKLFSVAAAWAVFGPDHRFETTVYATGPVDEEGTLRGDLVLFPQGDLTLGGRTRADGTIAYTNSDHIYASGTSRTELADVDPVQGLTELAQQLRARGIQRIRGDVVVDDRFFVPAESTGSGPRRVTPVMVNDNLVDLVVRPTEVGQRAEVEVRPRVPGLWVDNLVRTVDDGRATRVVLRVLGPYRLQLRGTITASQRPIVHVYEVPDPASFARALFIEELRKVGIELDASPLGSNPRERLPSLRERREAEVLARLPGPPFAEEAKLILKVSHNLHASALPILVGLAHGEPTLRAGLKWQGQVLRRMGVPVETISLGSGAGGSRADCVTPSATVALLRHMAARSDFDRFREALPVLGVDGTLHDAIEAGHPAAGRVFAKTGTYYVRNGLTGQSLLTAKALAGYVRARSGRWLAFAVFVNRVHLDGTSAGQVGRDLAAIAAALYEAY